MKYQDSFVDDPDGRMYQTNEVRRALSYGWRTYYVVVDLADPIMQMLQDEGWEVTKGEERDNIRGREVLLKFGGRREAT